MLTWRSINLFLPLQSTQLLLNGFLSFQTQVTFLSGGTVLVVCIKIRVEGGALSPFPCAQPDYLNSVLNHFSQQNL